MALNNTLDDCQAQSDAIGSVSHAVRALIIWRKYAITFTQRNSRTRISDDKANFFFIAVKFHRHDTATRGKFSTTRGQRGLLATLGRFV